MTTTLDIDEDMLEAAKALASKRNTTAGKVLSELARRALSQDEDPASGEDRVKHGIHLLPKREGAVVTSEMVYRLMDEE